MTRIAAITPAEADFAPFGAFLAPPARHNERAQFGHWLAPVDALELQCHLNSVAARALPVVLDRVEKHPHAAQVFLPVDVARYLVTVMPATDDGGPDPARALCVVVPGTRGVVYRPGVWHAGIMTLDRDGHFAVLMRRGAPDDDVIATIPPLTLTGLATRELAP